MTKRLLIMAICGITLLGGCGTTENTESTPVKVEETAPVEKPKKEYQPKEVANFNTAYVAKDKKNADGSVAVINVTSVEKRDNNIVINVNAPSYETIRYAVDNYMGFNLKSSEGKYMSDKLDKILVDQVNEDNTEIIINCTDITDMKWIEILPFKTKDNNFITFEIK